MKNSSLRGYIRIMKAETANEKCLRCRDGFAWRFWKLPKTARSERFPLKGAWVLGWTGVKPNLVLVFITPLLKILQLIWLIQVYGSRSKQWHVIYLIYLDISPCPAAVSYTHLSWLVGWFFLYYNSTKNIYQL